MIAVDTSVLAFAVNRYAPEHARAAGILEDLANGERPWGLPTPALDEFLRLVTHPHLAVRPLGPGDAAAFVERLLDSPVVRLLAPTPRHGTTLVQVLQELGGAVPAGLAVAVVLREHGVRELLSADAEMRRFGFLAVRDPVRGAPWTPGEPPARRYRRLTGRGT